jgi:hypothetical protein
MMKFAMIIGAAAMAAGVAVASPAQAASKLQACATQWNAAKAANQTEGKTYREFQKACLAKPADPAQAGAAKADRPKSAKAKKSSAGREALTARERACGAEWKADKAAGKVPAGTKWPQYWSACNKRKKDEAAKS